MAIDHQLADRGVDVPKARTTGQYLRFDAEKLLREISANDSPNRELFAGMFGCIVEPLCSRFSRVSIFAEMVAPLWARAIQEALEFERFWNKLISLHPLLLHCAYPKDVSTAPEGAPAFRDVCDEHFKILQTDSLRNDL